MRIAFLAIGGHIHTERWLQYFVDVGHEVHLVTVQPEPIPGVRVHDLRSGIPFKPLHYGAGLLRLRRLLGEIRPDLLHVHFLRGYGYWSAFAGFNPLVITVWGDDVYEGPQVSPLHNWLSRRAISRADLITGDSVDILDEVAKLGAPREKLHQIIWGVDFDLFRPQSGERFREQWGIPAQAPVVLSLRSFSRPYYNIDQILEMVPGLLRELPEAVTVFAAYDGEGADLKARAAELGVTESVRFVGRIPHADLPLALAAADVYLTVPSLDATSVSLMEAMACAKAIVASRLPSNEEWIEDGKNGVLIEPRDQEALTRSTIQLLRSPELRERYGRVSQEIAHRRAGFRENMERMETLCEELVSGRGRG